MEDWEKEVQETIRIQRIKDKIDSISSIPQIGDIVDNLSEEEAKKLLKLYIYSK